MKKLIALLSAILLFTGLKAQRENIIKKETTPAVKPTSKDSVKTSPATVWKHNPPEGVVKNKTIISKPKVVLPTKGIIIPETDKPIKGNLVLKPVKE